MQAVLDRGSETSAETPGTIWKYQRVEELWKEEKSKVSSSEESYEQLLKGG